jgi:AraC family transcriptional regulator
MMTDGAMHGWFGRLGKAAQAAPRPATRSSLGVHVRRALEIMRQERAASTADVATRLGLHPVYLARLFRERLGCSPGRMRQGLRLGAALDRIVQTQHPLVRVALAAGFADQSHLSRQVKRHAGVPAGVLRRLASGK